MESIRMKNIGMKSIGTKKGIRMRSIRVKIYKWKSEKIMWCKWNNVYEWKKVFELKVYRWKVYE